MTNDIIILVPGIGGSRLERDGKPIYDLSFGALPRLIWNWVGEGIAFRGGSGKPDDGVIATDLFNNQLIPGFFGVEDYDGLVKALQTCVRDPLRQFFIFPYDWRASNRWAAEALDAFVQPRLHAWRQGHGGADARLWLVCHSMGGFVARYFLEHLGGAGITRKLITIGTPHIGAPKSLKALVSGMGFGPLDFSTVIRSFASTYELLPQAPVVRVATASGDTLVRVADFFGMGSLLPVLSSAASRTELPGLQPLPNIDADRLRSALEFHKAIRDPVIRRLRDGEPRPYEITCLFNRRQRTPQSAFWDGAQLIMSDDPPNVLGTGEDVLFHQGDGTVPAQSATPIDWSDVDRKYVLNEKHVAMPSAKALIDQLKDMAVPLDNRTYMSGGDSDDCLGLAVPDLVMPGEPFEMQLDALRTARVTVVVAPVQSPVAPAFKEIVKVNAGACANLELNLAEPGTYRVMAWSDEDPRAIVRDWIVVPHSL